MQRNGFWPGISVRSAEKLHIGFFRIVTNFQMNSLEVPVKIVYGNYAGHP